MNERIQLRRCTADPANNLTFSIRTFWGFHERSRNVKCHAFWTFREHSYRYASFRGPSSSCWAFWEPHFFLLDLLCVFPIQWQFMNPADSILHTWPKYHGCWHYNFIELCAWTNMYNEVVAGTGRALQFLYQGNWEQQSKTRAEWVLTYPSITYYKLEHLNGLNVEHISEYR